ncbi:MAG TPA: ABC transporter ATP-binding protein [Terriglobales bacterium]|jgi:cobalt/nickel transport system ATP-binding protein|nr:ABC transporter ATP-binding protein [Terriglobales bacterium]
MPNLFELRDLSFSYDGIPALRGLSLEIAQGERVALVGANGSGKSTLLRLFDGLCFPAQGKICFEGEPLTAERLQNDDFALPFRRRVALVFQNPDVQLFNPSVFDEVAFAPLQLQWPKEKVLAKIEATLQLMGIAHLRDRPPYRLSGGEKKRVALASVLVLDPDVLLLDEPTATLDPRSQSQLIDLIQGWNGSSKTVISATHQLEIVEDIADRVFVLEEGRVAASGIPSEILSNHELLLRANLVHAHRHSHGNVVHSHPHIHSHSKHEHDH